MRLLPHFILAAMLILSVQPASSNDYDSVISRVNGFSGMDCACVIEIGASVEGRPVLALALADPESAGDGIRVLVICAQHGNEPVPVRAMLDLADELTNRREVLKNALIAIIPVANPDGYVRSRRLNAKGIDLNRDWDNLYQPETSCIADFVERLNPHVIIDLHEWGKESPGKPNCVEVAGFGDSSHLRLARGLASRSISSIDRLPFSVCHYQRERNDSLAHRYFSNQGKACMLVETAPEYPIAERRHAYRELVLAVLEELTSPTDTVLAADVNALLRSDRMPSLMPAIFTRPVEALDGSLPYWFVLGLAAGYVLLRAGVRGTSVESEVRTRTRRNYRSGRTRN